MGCNDTAFDRCEKCYVCLCTKCFRSNTCGNRVTNISGIKRKEYDGYDGYDLPQEVEAEESSSSLSSCSSSSSSSSSSSASSASSASSSSLSASAAQLFQTPIQVATTASKSQRKKKTANTVIVRENLKHYYLPDEVHYTSSAVSLIRSKLLWWVWSHFKKFDLGTHPHMKDVAVSQTVE